MKRDWELQELIEEWTLVPRELALLGNKTGSTRLGYSVLLKFFQREGRFPESRGDIAKAVLRYLDSYAILVNRGRSLKEATQNQGFR